MERLVKGDVVILLFPFSDLSSARKRPAVVVACLTGDDVILAQITSAAIRKDEYAILIESKDFKHGSLPIPSLIRANKLFTADRLIINTKIGTLKEDKMRELQEMVMHILRK